MFSKPIEIVSIFAQFTSGRSIRWLASVTAILLVGTTPSQAAYQFLNVTGNGVAGNGASAQFSGTNGVINVTHFFPNGGWGVDDNNDPLLFPSQFTTVFPGSGSVKGHLVQTVYQHTSVVTFDMTGYTITPDTVFGLWNTTDEVTKPVGGNPVYQVQLIDASNVQVNPNTFAFVGRQNNTGSAGVPAKHEMLLNTGNGEITFGTLINSSGIHTDATFWKSIPTTTKQIRVYADLPALNTIGDGVGYYFAELVVPEPCGAGLCVLGMFFLGIFKRQRRC